MIWEYSTEFYMEPFPNIPEINHENIPRIFRKNIVTRWV